MAGSPLCHFEIMSNNVEKAQAFYGAVLGWTFEKWPGPMDYITIKTGAPPEGGMMQKPPQAPMPMLSVYFLVPDVDATLAKATEHGARVLMGKTPIPEVGAFAMFMDPEGIPVSILEEKK